MHIFGIGLHVLVAVFFAIHAVRSGQPMYWLFILFAFPLLGSAVYALAVFLPQTRMQRGAQKAIAGAMQFIDPGRELRDAQAAFDDTPTAQNQMRLAAAHFNAGRPQEALVHYEKCVNGPFANDPEIRLGAAQAALDAGQAQTALQHTEHILRERPDYRAQDAALIRARALGALGRNSDTRQAFEDANTRFGGFDTKAEFAIWAATSGDTALAARLFDELERVTARWNSHHRELNAPLLARLNAARQALNKGA
jgi:hypothetical protein